MEKNEQNEKSIPLPALESKNLYIAPEIPKKKKKLPWIVGVLSVVLITFIGVAGYVTVDNANKAAETARMEQEYRNALVLMAEGKYEEALTAFEALDGYKDSSDKIHECIVLLGNQNEESDETHGKESEEITEEITTLHEHIEAIREGWEPTCTKTGMTDEVYCADCLEILAEPEVIPANGHVEEILPAVGATCTTAGRTRGEQCSVCQEVFVQQEIIEAKGHVYGGWIIDQEPDWGVKGSQHMICAVCHETKHETIEAIYSEGLEYSGTENDTYCVQGIGLCADSDVYIPPVYNGKSVTGIGVGAFENCSQITAVVLPDSMTSIGASAFEHCVNLTTVIIPDQVTDIGDQAFKDCIRLRDIVLPSSLNRISNSLFNSCAELTSITIPESVNSIAKSAFRYCSKLSSVTFGGEVRSIDDYAFFCAGLTSVEIPYGVTSIGESAFHGCEGITSVMIPNSVTDIGKRAFAFCSNITSIAIPDSVTILNDSVFSDCRKLCSVVVPGSVKSIQSDAFSRCAGLMEVYYMGSLEEWDMIPKFSGWNNGVSMNINCNYTP